MPALAALLTDAETRLKGASDSPRLDAELLLCHALGRPRSHLRAHPDAELDPSQARAFEALMAARARGEPLAYLTGKREFWSLELKVTPATLIPRPETELLVEQALARIPEGAAWRVLDLGTGSGAIALAIAKERPRARITATDRSADALAVARGNAVALGLKNLEFIEGDWFGAVPSHRFHLIASNPPYVAEMDPHLAQGDLRFEPRSALASGTEGLEDLRRIAAGAPLHLYKDGALLLEHGLDQGAAVRRLLEAAGFSRVRSLRDLSGHERVSGGDCANGPAAG
jgi:release factor glutamine methyltransferase